MEKDKIGLYIRSLSNIVSSPASTCVASVPDRVASCAQPAALPAPVPAPAAEGLAGPDIGSGYSRRSPHTGGAILWDICL